MFKCILSILLILYVAVTEEWKLTDPVADSRSLDSQKQKEHKDYLYLSETKENENDSSEDDNENNHEQGIAKLLERYSKYSMNDSVTVDAMGVKYVTKGTMDPGNHSAMDPGNHSAMDPGNHSAMDVGNVTLTAEPKLKRSYIDAIKDAYKWLDSEGKGPNTEKHGLLSMNETETLKYKATKELEGRSEGTAIHDNLTVNYTSSVLNATEASLSAQANGSTGEANTTLIGSDKPQARFGCIVNPLCSFCQLYAILPDDSRVCCLFCSIHPTLIPNNQGGFICSCNYIN